MKDLNWTCKSFEELSATELYRILELRNRVFVVEQNCVYNDTDEKDLQCHHLCCWQKSSLLAYVRIIPPGVSYEEPSIGRLVTDPGERHRGLGRELMKRAIEKCRGKYPQKHIKISAQSYLIGFYNNLGFFSTGKEYLEDGIPHTEMVLS